MHQRAVPEKSLRIASWNLEFLAERHGTGCHPRQVADYVEMRRIADSLDADVIDIQVPDRRAARDFRNFTEILMWPQNHSSDHCPVIVQRTR